MAEEPMNDLRNQLLKVAKSIRNCAETISAPEGQKGDDVAIPETFLCPLTRALMTDPVMLSSGYTYERFGIEDLLQRGLKTCPMTKEPLAHSNLTPNHLARVLIRNWCKQHNKSDLFQYSDSTPSYIRKEYFGSLHMKLLSSPDQKEAALELRKEVTDKSYFRKLYAERPEAIPRLLAPLSRPDGNSKIDPQVQEDLIAILMILSVNEKVKKVIAETPEAIRVLVDALRSENVKTQRNAASAFFQLSSIDSNKEILGTREAIVGMATLLIEETSALYLKDAAAALYRIFDNDKNKEIALKNGVLAATFQKIEENECVDIMLPILANLSTIEEGVNQMDKVDCFHLLRVIRGSLSAIDKEAATVILFNVLKKDGSKWKDLVKKEEVFNGTISDIFDNGTRRAKKMAEEMLDMLELEM